MVIAGLGFYQTGGDVPTSVEIISGEGYVANVEQNSVIATVSDSSITATVQADSIVVTVPGA